MADGKQDGALLDDVFVSLGWFGRYQRVQFLFGMLQILPCALHAMSVIFIGREMEHRCADVSKLNVSVRLGETWDTFDVMSNSTDQKLNVTYNQCSIDVMNGTETIYSTGCIEGYRYAENKDKSFVSEWDLVCDKESLSDVSQTLLAVGMLVGAAFFPTLADVFGRKPIFMFCQIFYFLVALANAFSPDYVSFGVMRLFMGALQQGTGIVATVLLMELFPTQRRAFVSQVGSFAWPGSLLVLNLIAYLTKEVSWRITQLVFSACSVYVLIQWWISDESVRWLVANNKITEAERILQKASKANKVDQAKAMAVFRPKPDTIEMNLPFVNSQLSRSDDVAQPASLDTSKVDPPVLHAVEAKDEMRLMAFVKNKYVFTVTAMCCYMWFTDSATYYGLLLTSASLTDDLYLGFFLNVLVEVPAAAAFGLLINRIGRKACMMIFHLVGALSLLTATILSNIPAAEGMPGIKIVTLIIALIGKFGVTTGFATLWQYTPELFPTNLRNSGFGFSSVSARIAGMIAPYSRTFGRHVPWGPGVVFSGLCFLVPIMVYFLPETYGHELPQTLAELDIWFESQRNGRKSRQSSNKT